MKYATKFSEQGGQRRESLPGSATHHLTHPDNVTILLPRVAIWKLITPPLEQEEFARCDLTRETLRPQDDVSWGFWLNETATRAALQKARFKYRILRFLEVLSHSVAVREHQPLVPRVPLFSPHSYPSSPTCMRICMAFVCGSRPACSNFNHCDPAILFLGIYRRWLKTYIRPHKNVYHSSTLHNSQKFKTTQMSINT